MLLPAIQRLRQEGIKIFVYVDDILIIANSPTECWRQTLRMRKLLSSLGWIVREDKSSMAPSSEIIFLGFLINSRTMTLRLPQGKAHTIVHELRRFARRHALPGSQWNFSDYGSETVLCSPLLIFILTALGVTPDTPPEVRDTLIEKIKESLRRHKRTVNDKGASFAKGTANFVFSHEYTAHSRYFDFTRYQTIRQFFEFASANLFPQ